MLWIPAMTPSFGSLQKNRASDCWALSDLDGTWVRGQRAPLWGLWAINRTSVLQEGPSNSSRTWGWSIETEGAGAGSKTHGWGEAQVYTQGTGSGCEDCAQQGVYLGLSEENKEIQQVNCSPYPDCRRGDQERAGGEQAVPGCTGCSQYWWWKWWGRIWGMESSGAKKNQEGQRRSRSVSNKMDLEISIGNGMDS